MRSGQAVPVYALVLAAGQGRRFGGGKLLALYRGRPLLSYVLDVVATACERRFLDGGHVVVATEDARAQTLCERVGLEPILNDAPYLGLSYSLRLGLGALEKRMDENVGAALVFLGDQPLVRLEVIESLIAAWRERSQAIVRPRYAADPAIPGHPTLLARSIWPLARELQGDSGFATLLASPVVRASVIDVPGNNPDVDTRADLHTLEESSP